MNESVKKSRIKPSKIVTVIATVVMVAFIVAAIVLGVNIPRSARLYADTGVRSLAETKDDEWFMLTLDSVMQRLDEKGDIIDTLDVKALAAEAGYDEKSFGFANSVNITSPDSENIYIATSTNLLLQLRIGEEGYYIAGATQLAGPLSAIEEKDGVLYVLNLKSTAMQINKYDINNLSVTPKTGYLYTPKNIQGNWVLEYIPQSSIFSFEILEYKGRDFAYIVFNKGMLRFSVDLEVNGWQDELLAWVENRVEEKIAASEEYKNSTEEQKATLYNAFRKEASEEVATVYADKGIVGYDVKTGDITMSNDLYRKSNAYLFHPLTGRDFRGAGYDETNERYYLLTQEKCVYTYNVEDLPLTSNAELLLDTTVEGVELPATPVGKGHALFYNSYLNVGYIVYHASNLLTRVDFNTGTLTFNTKTNDGIAGLIQNSNGVDCYYVYNNRNEANADELILRSIGIKNQEHSILLQSLMTTAIVFAVVAAIVLLIAALCVFKPGFSDKFMDTMRLIKKHWLIYVVVGACFSLVGLFCYYPAIGSISLSFFDYTLESESKIWNNFGNYIRIFTASKAGLEFGNMLLFLATDVFTALLPPLIFAFFLTIMRNKQYSAVMRTLLFIPGIIPGIASTLIWKSGIYDYPGGVLNMFIQWFNGKPFDFMNHDIGTRISIIMMGFPFVGSYLIFYGAMMNVPDSYYEAAELDGITVIKRFVYIDVPLIFPQIKYVLIMTFIGSVQNFGRTYMIDQANSYQTNTPIHTMYKYTIDGNYGMASAYATVLFIFLFGATVFNMYSQKRDREGD